MRTLEPGGLLRTYLVEHSTEAKDILKSFLRIIPFQNLIFNRIRSDFTVGVPAGRQWREGLYMF